MGYINGQQTLCLNFFFFYIAHTTHYKKRRTAISFDHKFNATDRKLKCNGTVLLK